MGVDVSPLVSTRAIDRCELSDAFPAGRAWKAFGHRPPLEGTRSKPGLRSAGTGRMPDNWVRAQKRGTFDELVEKGLLSSMAEAERLIEEGAGLARDFELNHLIVIDVIRELSLRGSNESRGTIAVWRALAICDWLIKLQKSDKRTAKR